jgi:hypothetical protein
MEVQVSDALVRGGIPEEEEEPGEVMLVEFGATVSRLFHAYPGAK